MNEIGQPSNASPTAPNPIASRLRYHAAAWAALLVIGTLQFIQSYQRWGHPIIDMGRDVYLPSQVLQGRTLYQELHYNYGPTVPYMLAGATAALGDGLWVFAAVGLVIGVLTTIALYAIGAWLGGRIAGFGAALMFLVFGFFANSTWGCNFVIPYSYAATLGIACALWSLYFLYRYLYDGRSRASLALSVALLFATVFTKHEIGLAIGLTHALAWWAHRIPRKTIAVWEPEPPPCCCLWPRLRRTIRATTHCWARISCATQAMSRTCSSTGSADWISRGRTSFSP
jgi:hypothetical protein